MSFLPEDHFLSQMRPDTSFAPGAVDTTTLAAHDFDVDNRTGFMPPQPPPARLPATWEPWETVLESAQKAKLQLGSRPNILNETKAESGRWRTEVTSLPVLPLGNLVKSEVMLRRAHHVLAWVMHFYVHTLPPSAMDIPIVIPRPITVPLLQVCRYLNLPPVLTYSDDVLYNWDRQSESDDSLRSQTTFTGTTDEQEFYLTSARMELRGVSALELMRGTMDEAFVGDDIAVRRITGYLTDMASVIDDLKVLLLRVREGCDPQVFYHDIRPWFRGKEDREWIFEGLEESGCPYPSELSGPSAGQSSLVHALDIFLGVSHYSHTSSTHGNGNFLERMQAYMPRHHRNFLNHLSANPRPLRDMVQSRGDEKLLSAYNLAVNALKEFRDAHIIIVTSYIISPAARERREQPGEGERTLKGTGGTDLSKFLKGTRDGTQAALIERA